MTNELPGMWDKSDLTGGQTDCDRATQEKMREEFDPTDEQCDRIAALTMDKLAAKHGIHALDLNPSVTEHNALRRSIVRVAHNVGASRSAETIASLRVRNFKLEAEYETIISNCATLEKQLAAAQADNARLLKEMERAELACAHGYAKKSLDILQKALAQPLDTSALDTYFTDAKRYRALRNQDIENNFPRSGIFIGRIPANTCLTGADADMAIDSMFGLSPAPDKQGKGGAA